MQESKVVELLHYNPFMTSAMLNEYQKKGWQIQSIFCTDTKYRYNAKHLQKTLEETANKGHFKDDYMAALTVGIKPKGCIFTVFLIRDVPQ